MLVVLNGGSVVLSIHQSTHSQYGDDYKVRVQLRRVTASRQYEMSSDTRISTAVVSRPRASGWLGHDAWVGLGLPLPERGATRESLHQQEKTPRPTPVHIHTGRLPPLPNMSLLRQPPPSGSCYDAHCLLISSSILNSKVPAKALCHCQSGQRSSSLADAHAAKGR